MTDDDRQPQTLDALEGDIRASRARIDGTVEALRDRTAQLRDRLARWTPKSLMEHTMKHTYTPATPDTPAQRAAQNQGTHNQGPDRYDSGQTMRHGGGRSRSSGSMMDNITSSPIPLAMVGIGLGWLALSSTGYDRRIVRSRAMTSARHRLGDAAEYARESLSGAGESVRNAASSAYDSASGTVSGAYDSVSGMMGSGHDDETHRTAGRNTGHSTGGTSRMASMVPSRDDMRHRMHSVSSGFWDMVEDHPIVAGAMGVALGAAIGAALPGTRYENQWVGDYADEATERAKGLAKEALDRGTRAAQAAVESARDEVRDAVTAATDAAREEAKKPS
ncbi:hypothetical protein [Azospirillum sp. TSO35-2]|uniref:hypothetical protein n=1 Tax=Azospirillum sp. TSO35-2 TaxID=716796 RepID=UPI000D6099DE|nr:hypothetical protein [Azospirillum sp. TSO35-2]PWC33335.1 hypothetical protein TSO352_22870 [Azospirillum sp. TSO35-2]